MTLTKRGERVLATTGVLAFLLVLAFVGGVEQGTIAVSTALQVLVVLVAAGLGLVYGGPRWAAMVGGLTLIVLAVA